MTTALSELNLPVTRYGDEKDWTGVITSAAFLPRVQLFGSNSEAVKEGKIGIGRWGLVRAKDQIEDLTQEFDCLPLSWRFKGMRIGDGNIVNVYDPKSEEFKKIMGDAETPDSGTMYGRCAA